MITVVLSGKRRLGIALTCDAESQGRQLRTPLSFAPHDLGRAHDSLALACRREFLDGHVLVRRRRRLRRGPGSEAIATGRHCAQSGEDKDAAAPRFTAR